MRFETRHTGWLISHYENLFSEGLKRLCWIEKMVAGILKIEDIGITTAIGRPYGNFFDFQELQNEIRHNLLNITDEEAKLKYLHYLIKLEWSLKEVSRKAEKSRKKLKELKDYDEWPLIDYRKNDIKYISEEDLFGHCNYLLNAPLFNGICFWMVIREEFRYDIEKWKELVAQRKTIVPSYEDIKSLFTVKNTISTPNEKAIASTNQLKVAWKAELKEFAELIDQLQQKGWIEINDGELKPTVETLCQVFDFTGTKKREDSNTSNSLIQYLKPSERENKIYTKKYTQKFSTILSNSREK